MTNVYVINKSSHDFSRAEDFGQLVFLSEGPINRYQTNNMYRQFMYKMKDSGMDDYIVPCALNVMNCIACAIFAKMHGRLNLLLYRNGIYIERNLVL